MTEPEPSDTAMIIDGRYRVLRRIGSGGMADVVCAEDLQLGRNVAIKLLHRRFAEDAEFVERFRREASSAAGLQHPHVVAVFDRGEWDGTYYIAMEHLEGRSLKRLVQDEGPLPAPLAIELAIQILRAARFAHKRGIIHRDLKPHNVIVDDGTPTPHAKVTDFGIAKAGASDMTQTGSIMGTAQYLSPEQAQGHTVSAASDLYSVGIILYEMLTGRVPFEGESAVAIALKQVNEAPVPPRVLNPDISPALEAVVLRALEKDPARRFTDSDEFIAALEGAAAGVAPPPAPGEVTQVLRAPAALPVPVPVPVVDVRPAEPVHAEVYPAPLPPPDPDAHGPGRWWVAVVVGLLILAVIGAGLLFFNTTKVDVPNVVGAQQAEAKLALKRQGLAADITPSQSPTQAAGIVIGQVPQGGSRADKGSSVTLVVSSGPGTAQIPELRGQPRSQARKELQQAGFKIVEERRADDGVGPFRAIETRPASGEVRDRGTQVVLVISSGKTRLGLPRVVDLTEADARSTLEGLGFTVITKSTADSEHDPGTVLKQAPSANAQVPKGSEVVLTVAKAPPPVDVPDVTGLGRLAATHALRKAGFTVDETSQPVSTPDQDRRVLAQDPVGGQAEQGSVIAITVGAYQPGATTPGTETTPPPTNPAPGQ